MGGVGGGGGGGNVSFWNQTGASMGRRRRLVLCWWVRPFWCLLGQVELKFKQQPQPQQQQQQQKKKMLQKIVIKTKKIKILHRKITGKNQLNGADSGWHGNAVLSRISNKSRKVSNLC